jgi:8-oxo-dGTP pyrophosphatase MutT (NUDIX family)
MPHESWTLLGSRIIAEYKFVRIREDHYRFEPTRAEAPFVVCESADWVLVIAVTEHREVILVRQYRHGVREVVLEIPGGVVDAGESPEETALRELCEETGFVAEGARLVGTMMPNAAINSASCHVVLAEGCRRTKRPKLDPFEKIDVLLRPRDEIPEMIRTGQIRHALVIAAFALADTVLGSEPR